MPQTSFYLLTLGCPKNEVVSEQALSALIDFGLESVTEPEKADLLIVNPCSFIQNARDEALACISKLVRHKKTRQRLYVFGCFTQRFQKSSQPMIAGVDGFFLSWQDLFRFITSEKTTVSQRLKISPTRAYVEIAQGCSRYCAYCTIPFFKGPFYSKPVKNILSEIKQLLDLQIKEIILVAQETTLYGSDQGKKTVNLAKLLQTIVKTFPHLPRLRIMYAHPMGITEELIETIKRFPQICHYLDLPLQHSHPTVLKAMRRPFDTDKTDAMLKKIRQSIPDLSLRSTFMVGFPGESKEEFNHLLRFLKKWKFEKAGFFAFSPESETKAYSMRHQVPDEIKQQRLSEAYAVQTNISEGKNMLLIGKKIVVLTEYKRGENWVGRSFREAPEIDGNIFYSGPSVIGAFHTVLINQSRNGDLYGKIINEEHGLAQK